MRLSVMYLAVKIFEMAKSRSAQAYERNCRSTDLDNTAAMVGGNAFPICLLMSVLLAQVANR